MYSIYRLIEPVQWYNNQGGIRWLQNLQIRKKVLRTTQRKQQKMQQLRKHRQQKKLLPPQRKVLAVRQKELQII